MSFTDIWPEWGGVMLPHGDRPPLAWEKNTVVNTLSVDGPSDPKQEEQAIMESEGANMHIRLGEGAAAACGDIGNDVVR